jgi:acetylornithine deacetylase/succinyl-diaminopimelate desuccinylase-like protein
MSYKNWFKDHEERIFKEFMEYLSIPTISADPKHKGDLLKGATFIQKKLQNLGLEVTFWELEGEKVVFGEKMIDPQFPTILIYGHYDVQPPDPLDEWLSPPFSPQEREGRIYARGAEDNKGQHFYTLCALEAFYEKNKHPKINVKVLIEGEEEVGSKSFEAIAKKYQDRLKADSVWIVDMDIKSYATPVLCLGCRGIASLEVEVSNASFDVHSGAYGGALYNPIQALSEMIASVYDEKGHIAIAGFYDGIHSLTDGEKKQLHLDTPKKIFEKDTGGHCFRKEEGYCLQESISIRPTFEVNGIFGGYQGEGSKTIIPKKATAKITCRLVAGQDPEKIAQKVANHFLKVAPKGMKVSFVFGGGGKSYWGSLHDYTAGVFAKIIEEITQKECKFGYNGGSIPLASTLQEASEGECIFLGMGLSEDRIHSPNESFGKKQFEDGFIMIAKGLEVFAQNKHQW